MAYHHEKHGRKKARAMLNRAGYASGGHVHARDSDEAEDEKLVAKGVHKHESNMHKGEPKTKLKSGGAAHGFASGGRLDQKSRGKSKGKSGKGTHITIVNMPHHPSAGGPPGGPMPVGGAGAPPIPPRPPIGVPPGGPGGPGAGPAVAPNAGPGLPPGMPMRPPGMKKGGAVGDGKAAVSAKKVGPGRVATTAGGLSGMGTRQKATAHGMKLRNKGGRGIGPS